MLLERACVVSWNIPMNNSFLVSAGSNISLWNIYSRCLFLASSFTKIQVQNVIISHQNDHKILCGSFWNDFFSTHVRLTERQLFKHKSDHVVTTGSQSENSWLVYHCYENSSELLWPLCISTHSSALPLTHYLGPLWTLFPSYRPAQQHSTHRPLCLESSPLFVSPG